MAQTKYKYYVLDARASGRISHATIEIDEGGQRFVMLTAPQAKYFVDQGVVTLSTPTVPPNKIEGLTFDSDMTPEQRALAMAAIAQTGVRFQTIYEEFVPPPVSHDIVATALVTDGPVFEVGAVNEVEGVPPQLIVVTMGQSLAEYAYFRGQPRVARKFGEWLREDLGYPTSGTFNSYDTHGPNSTWHDGTNEAATDFKVKLINCASGGAAMLDVAPGGEPTKIADENYHWNSQDNSAATGNALDLPNTPGPLLRNAKAVIEAEGHVDVVNISIGTTDMGVAKEIEKQVWIDVIAEIRESADDPELPIVIHRHGRHQVSADAGSQTMRDIQTELAAELPNVYIGAEEYPARLAISGVTTGAGITENTNVVTVPDTEVWQNNEGLRHAAFAIGTYVTAVTPGAPGSITLSRRDSRGIVVPSPAASGSTDANATVYKLDAVHPYPGSDGIEPLDGAGGTQHNLVDGLYGIFRRASRSIAMIKGAPGIEYRSGPRLQNPAGDFGTREFDIDFVHDGGDDFTPKDVTGWRVERAGVPITIESVVRVTPVKIRLLTTASLLEGSYGVWYAYGSILRASYEQFIYDNADPIPMPLQPTSPVAMPFVIGDPALEPETTAIINAHTTPPDADWQARINRIVAYYKATGVWDLLDSFHVLGRPDAQAARIDWKVPGSIATENGTLTFTADRGYTGSAGWLGSGYNPASASRGMTVNDAHFGLYALTTSSSSNADLCSGNDRLRIRARASSSGFVRINSSTQTTYPNDTFGSATHMIGVRRDAVNQIAFRQGVKQIEAAAASLGLPGELELGRQAGGATYSDRQWFAFHSGRAFTDQQAMDCFTGLRNLARSIGAVA